MPRRAHGLFLLLLGAAGCGPSGDLPRTYPADGVVVYRDGSPMKGGSVQFSTRTDPLLRVMGQVGEDGTFSLYTFKDRARAAGAPEGEFQVSVTPPLQGGHRGLPPINLPRPYRVEAKENHFRIELNIPPP